MAVQRPQKAGHVLGLEAGLIQQPREQMMDQHVLRSVDVLRRVHRLLHGDALAPPNAVRRHSLEEQDVALCLNSERRLERCHQRQADPPQLHSFQLHALCPPHPAPKGPPRDSLTRRNSTASSSMRYVPPPAGRTPSATTTPYPGNRFASPRASAARPPACPSHGWIC